MKIKEKNKGAWAIAEHGKHLIKSSSEKGSLELKKKNLDELVNERMFEIKNSNEGINFNNLTYYHTSKNDPKYSVRFKDSLIVYNDIKMVAYVYRKKKKFKKNFDKN